MRRLARSIAPTRWSVSSSICAVIRGEAKPLVTVRDGLQNLKVTEAIAEAARTARVVEVG